MPPDDMVSLVELGIKTFASVNTSTNRPYGAQTRITPIIANEIYQIGQKLYKLGLEARQNRTSPLLTSNWRLSDGRLVGFSYQQEYGSIVLRFQRSGGGGYNDYIGGGQAYSNYIAVVVAGYNYDTRDFLVIKGISNDGYVIDLAIWSQSDNSLSYWKAARDTEWS